MDKKTILTLNGLDGIGLIIPCQSGVIISHQCGGLACCEYKIEGVYLPIEDSFYFNKITPEIILDKLYNYFGCTDGSVWDGRCWNGITKNDADFIDSLFENTYFEKCIWVNRKKRRQSMEACVHVLYKKNIDYLINNNFKTNEAILVWLNSD
jgi:hypothetical protein